MLAAQRLSTVVVLLGGLALTTIFVVTPAREQHGPFVPRSDAEVVEQVPRTPRAPTAPLDEAGALRLATEFLAEAERTNDPRLLGRAQAALGPWATSPEPTAALRLIRARLAQRQGELATALELLGPPDSEDGWALRARLLFSLARYPEALEACAHVEARAWCELPTRAVTAKVDDAPDDSAEHLRSLARARRWRGDLAGAVTLLAQALALEPELPELRAEYAELLLDLGRGQEVAALFAGRALSDRELLAVVLGGDETRAPELAARMDANRQRDDGLGLREELRYALLVEHDAPRAVAVATKNWARSREPDDARWLLEAAAAAKDPAAAKPVREWLAGTTLAWEAAR